ncbi:sugar isomerase domain-containing protein [Pseudonocardia sp. GCM10023141]|uniref:sugar isomerase domain-containing protein n=1 Tax=Pseudonocardia sp. GCM10023141 TaxID=3252653 RepID=UPI0036241125
MPDSTTLDTAIPASGVSGAAFAGIAEQAVRTVAAQQADGVRAAADLVVEGLRAGGVVQAFGTGHSQAFAMEIAGRAGGLVPTNMIALRDVVTLGGEPPAVLFGGPEGAHLERDPAVARRIYDLNAPQPTDVFMMASNSGGNGSVVELARVVKEHGHPLIAVTSLAHTTQVTSRHPSGLRLFEIADVVLDNGAPYGDATLSAGGVAVGAISSITAALLAQMIVAEVVATMLAAGETPPVYLSANVPEGDAHNTALEARYAGRIRRSA